VFCQVYVKIVLHDFMLVFIAADRDFAKTNENMKILCDNTVSVRLVRNSGKTLDVCDCFVCRVVLHN
jgi:hypothetical protein